MTGKLEVYVVWRCQIVPDFTLTFSNQAREIIAPIKLKIVEDSTNHPDSPLGIWFEINDPEDEDFDYEPFISVPGMT